MLPCVRSAAESIQFDEVVFTVQYCSLLEDRVSLKLYFDQIFVEMLTLLLKLSFYWI